MSLGELIKAYDEQQRQQQQPVASSSTSTSPATIASTLSSSSSTIDSLELIPEESFQSTSATAAASVTAVHTPAESGILAQFLSVVPNVSLDLPAQGTASARLRASLGLPDLATLPPLRTYEHLATLLPKSAWKKQGKRCDMWECETLFKLFDGRRHCRKCGGIFCKEHIARATPLIDMSRVPDHLPPRGRHIQEFHSELTPVTNDALVCDGCHDLIHGVVAQPRTRSKPRLPATTATTTTVVVESKTLSAPPAAPVTEKRKRRKSTKSSSSSSRLHASISSGSHPSHSSSSLARTPPTSSTSTSPPPPPADWVPPALCDANGHPLSPGLATLRMLQLGRAACYSPTFDPAVLDLPLGLSKNRKPDTPRSPVPPTAAQLLEQNYPLCVPSAVCKARASERRKEAWLAEMRRAGRAVDVDA
ncbi:hypothetical protein BKA62DRAFT_303676 [Auriculariales sp. MPI-PUGE-AT-0066]|nr:hypothetical protein BKA62DRAFT_303676 [Auriculariales sp. MPI-PUGE-AT-0066]